MSFAQSFYADQKKVEQQPRQQENASPLTTAAIPAHTPIAEDPLTPAQIQEAIRIYRSVLSTNSAPASPVRAPAAPPIAERPEVHSNYYGGGPTDIPQSYLLNYATSSPQQPASAPATQAPEPLFTEQQLIAQLQALQVQQQQVAEPVCEVPVVQQQQQLKAAPNKAPVLQKMYDDEESGYCFNRKGRDEDGPEEIPEAHVATPTSAPAANYSIPAPQQQVNYSPAPVANNYSKVVCGPSEYIGMANDNKFIYDAQKALPVSYAQNNSYTLVNPTAQAPIAQPRFEETDDQGVTTTEDVTQVPASPAVTSRFRGMIRNAQTPVQAPPAPIVVERVAEPVNTTPSHNYNNYGAFMPVNQMSMESEYQLPVLNDLASCIEHY
ncbi:hypothetical protein L5515_013393 [Caenorhabditis briggsae]|uniref:Uncharacterized protein n=1 Tax=Caenorhabditis briggsae TaxID=6238 RepID=A0AAE9EAI2_CAEBR|nr:hypothetical protein L5515_013393 [Caenorhabditis briggsae]